MFQSLLFLRLFFIPNIRFTILWMQHLLTFFSGHDFEACFCKARSGHLDLSLTPQASFYLLPLAVCSHVRIDGAWRARCTGWGLLLGRLCVRSWFLSLTIDILGLDVSDMGGCPVQCRMFSSISSLFLPIRCQCHFPAPSVTKKRKKVSRHYFPWGQEWTHYLCCEP